MCILSLGIGQQVNFRSYKNKPQAGPGGAYLGTRETKNIILSWSLAWATKRETELKKIIK